MIAAIAIRKSRICGLTALLLLVVLGLAQALLSGSEGIRKDFKEVPSCGVEKFDVSMENPLWMRHQLKSGAESEFSVVMWEMCEGKYAGYVERFPGKVVFVLTTPSHLSSSEKEAEIVFCQCLHKFVFSFVGPVEPSEEVVLVTRGMAMRIEPDESWIQ